MGSQPLLNTKGPTTSKKSCIASAQAVGGAALAWWW